MSVPAVRDEWTEAPAAVLSYETSPSRLIVSEKRRLEGTAFKALLKQISDPPWS